MRWSPLDTSSLAAAAGPRWRVRLHERAASTNALAAAEAADGAPPGLVVVADHQTSGRGRLDRRWETPPGLALTFSALVDAGVPDERWPLLPLATALAVADGVRRCAGNEVGAGVGLKWPNDVLVGERKVCGILLERVTGGGGRPLAVVGIGVNVAQRADELPVDTATSLALEGATVDRTALLGSVLAALDSVLADLRRDPDAVLAAYRARCSTVGADVRVSLPGGAELHGTAEDVDRHGRIVVAGTPVGAGDVVHLRTRSSSGPDVA